MAKNQGIVFYFLAGLMVLVLLILSGIVAFIVNVILVAFFLVIGIDMPIGILIVVFVVGIIILGWVFTRFKVGKR